MNLDELIHSGFANMKLLEHNYLVYLEDPSKLDMAWRRIFDQLERSREGEAAPIYEVPKDYRIYSLIDAYRKYGHLMATVNPIATETLNEPPQLDLQTLGFSEGELDQPFPTVGLLPEAQVPLKEILAMLKDTYCGNIGLEYSEVENPPLEEWLQGQIEPNRFKIKLSIEQKKMILQHLNKSELFEVFLHTKYVGQKRFSLEGSETLIPMLAAIIDTGTSLGLEEFVLGMAHRGRLNVLSNILQKSYGTIFSEFEEGYIPDSFEGSGDVKYHKGFFSDVKTASGNLAKVVLTPNPSHLEAVDPVVEGQVRAKQMQRGDEGKKEKVVPILIHGDAALAGQGIVYETMQLYKLEGYATGGSIHIVINNQIGFTTLPQDGRSTQYCTDIAKAFNAPVFHVNAEDPEGCVYATLLALELRQRFHCDVFIDLNCYRKYGHNESDEPAFTQPIEYQLIRKKKPIREIYRDDLIRQGVLERQIAEELEAEFKSALQEHLTQVKLPKQPVVPNEKKEAPKRECQTFVPINTGVSKEKLKELIDHYCTIPEGFTIHSKLERQLQDHREMAQGNKPIDWGMGETLAYATLLIEGTPIRLSGQDTCRGTFSHRHALWMDQISNRSYIPLRHLQEGQGRFDIYNSPLSEYAVLGFEFGYSLAAPEWLVIWEAQFGDFCNGAQVIIDQFISTSEMKWGQKNRVVLFLPHGYEGQGPEHSSARLERFLTLSGNNNMQVTNPTLPSQLFHLLRRHQLKPIPKPLIVLTPKGLLRHPDCVSTLEMFASGSFEEVLDDPESPKKARKLVFCSGRIYYDLAAQRKKLDVKDMAIIRLEQLYPFHEERVMALVKKYKGFKECFWVQDEPENMGAWDFILPRLGALLPDSIPLQYVGRKRSASPAVGSYALHKKETAEISHALFGEMKNKAKKNES